MKAFGICRAVFWKSLIVSGLLLASCAHQESFEGSSEFYGDSSLPYTEGESLAAEEGAPPADLQLGDFSDPAFGATDTDLGADSMMAEGEADVAAAEQAPADTMMPDTLGGEAPAMGDLGSDPLAAAPADPMAGEMTDSLEPAAEAPASEPAPEMVATQESTPSIDLSDYSSEPAEMAEPVIGSPELVTPEATVAAAPARPRPKPLRTPRVSTEPMERDGTMLNRYYVLRAGDTPEGVSRLLYGDSQREADLRRWNGKASWRAGSVVYYASPLQSEDGEMRSFYQERGMIAREYTVRPGDTLAEIARREYGDKDSWREIGVVNEISRPNQLSAGQVLALFPRDLTEYSMQVKARQEESVVAERTPDEAPAAADDKAAAIDNEIAALEQNISNMEKEIGAGEGLASAEPPVNPNVEEAPALTEAARQEKPKLASVEVGFFRQNLALILIIAGLGTFLLFYFFIKKSRDLGGDF